MPLTLAAPVHSERIIKKSRFIGCVQPMADRAAAQKVVAELWAQHPGARHVCWALLAGGQSAMFHYGSKDQNVWACIHGELSAHGRDREIIDRYWNPVLAAWYPGEEGGTAIAETLAGLRGWTLGETQARTGANALAALPRLRTCPALA